MLFPLLAMTGAVENAVANGEPAHVAKYAFQLAQAFSNFYQKYPIIHEDFNGPPGKFNFNIGYQF